MSLDFIRYTRNPSHKVTLGLCPPKIAEQFSLSDDLLNDLSDKAQKVLAILLNTSDQKGVIIFQCYTPVVDLGLNKKCYVNRYRGGDLLDRFSAPVKFDVDCVRSWIWELTERTVIAENDAELWIAGLDERQKAALEDVDDDSCMRQLRDLTDNQTYILGPYDVRWYLSSEAVDRKERIERTRRQRKEATEKAEREQDKEKRAVFVKHVVDLLGNASQQCRLIDNLLPMQEVCDLVHKYVTNGLYEYLVETNDFATRDGIVKLNEDQYERFVSFRTRLLAASDQKELPVFAYIKPVFGNIGDDTIVLAEITIFSKNSPWTSTEWYYLD